jgi:hypothetical protein
MNTKEKRNQIIAVLYQNMAKVDADDALKLVDELISNSLAHPYDQFNDLKKFVIKRIDEIDSETRLQNTKPKWWFEMMVLQEFCR